MVDFLRNEKLAKTIRSVDKMPYQLTYRAIVNVENKLTRLARACMRANYNPGQKFRDSCIFKACNIFHQPLPFPHVQCRKFGQKSLSAISIATLNVGRKTGGVLNTFKKQMLLKLNMMIWGCPKDFPPRL